LSSIPPRREHCSKPSARSNPAGPRLVAFFGVLYHSGLRPEEAVGLRRQDVELPALLRDEDHHDWREPDDPWRELHLRAARPDVGGRWTDDGSGRDRRGLKHRAEGETRRVPCPPPLTKLLRDHLSTVAGKPADPLFRGSRAARLPPSPTGGPGESTQRSADGRGVPLPACAQAMRPSPRMPVHLAQRGSSSNPGGRLGRPQCRDATRRLCQVPRRPRRDRQGPYHCRIGS